VPGVTGVEVDYATKTAQCKVADPTKFDSSAAIAALDKAGFKESKLKE
jgi:copper chaperone CopZ